MELLLWSVILVSARIHFLSNGTRVKWKEGSDLKAQVTVSAGSTSVLLIPFPRPLDFFLSLTLGDSYFSENQISFRSVPPCLRPLVLVIRIKVGNNPKHHNTRDTPSTIPHELS